MTGKATYDSVPNLIGPLVYADTVVKPVRAASVEVVDGKGAAVATATTGEDGTYTVTVPAGTMLKVRVQARLLRSGGAPSWDVSVRDNTKENALYSMDSVAFASGTAALRRDLHAASGWDGVSAYKSVRVAAPFAVMDTVHAAMQKVQSAAPATKFPALKVFWSPNNRPANGVKADGEIGISHFVQTLDGPALYILGKEDVDTDEFDSSVIVHEWGHYYQAVFSRDDSPGGLHAGNDRLDRRIAFSEGWGNGWSGIVLGRSNYTDSSTPGQAQGGNIDLSQGPTDNPGWYREFTVQSILWNLNAQVGFKPIHDALTSERFKTRAALTSIHSFVDAFNAVAPASMPALAALLRPQGISDAPDNPFGLLETNAGTPPVANALPMHIEAQVGVAKATCVSNEAGTRNKLGNVSYFHFTAPQSRDYPLVLLPSTEGTSMDISVFRGGALPQFTMGTPGASSTPNVALTAGADYIAAVRDLNGTAACFSLTIQ
ncbi:MULTISPECIES: carboxypeptidase-like regulatory domain-containing protein [unclassified Variovorax]|uniref:carboxypeptidase-like regulatory domain-containing protein n=1 Tax=unclassified Variovorax TaxID=663243 RepID=UPI003F47ECE8